MKSLLEKLMKEQARRLSRRVNVGLLGLGETNKALLNLLSDIEDIDTVTVRENLSREKRTEKTAPYEAKDTDKIQKSLKTRRESSFDTVKFLRSEDAFDNLFEDVIFPSPSVRRENLKAPTGALFVSDYDLLFGKGAKNLFLVSGSDGKSTTVDMAAKLLFPRFPDIFTGGNIGTPLWYADSAAEAFLLELSSFTLRYSKPSGSRALLTNVTPNHLDWHECPKEYEDTKLSLIYSADEPILNLCDGVSQKAAREINAFCLISMNMPREEILARYKTEHTVTVENGFLKSDGEVLVKIAEVKNREKHNIMNLASAVALSIGYADKEHIRAVAKTYTPLGERCETLDIGGVYCVSSSIDTTPERTRATLTGIGRRVRLILGGRGKGLSLEPLKDCLSEYTERIAVYGEISLEIMDFINSDESLAKIPHEAYVSLDGAIDYALDDVKEGDTVLLSPAATSYGEFKNYIERGKHFKERVKARLQGKF